MEEVETLFGKQVAEIVRGATELEKLEKKVIEKQSSWQERKEHAIHFLQHEATTDQLLVSGADKLDNLRSIAYDHKRIGEEIWKRFNAGKEQQAWYYTSISAIMENKGKENHILLALGNGMKELCKNVF